MTTSLRVIVADDEPLALERVASLVEATPDLVLVGRAKNGIEALDQIEAADVDLLFVDIEMPVLSGFSVVLALETNRLPGIIFVTAYDHYAVQAFEVGAIDYLLKPVTKARFATAVERARARLRRPEVRRSVQASALELERARGHRARFVVRRGSAHQLVPVAEIEWIEAADNYLKLHCGSATHLARGTIAEAERELDPSRFVRIHRSTLVAIDHVTGAQRLPNGGYVVVLRGGAKLRASRRHVAAVQRLLASSR